MKTENCTRCGQRQIGGLHNGLCNNCNPVAQNLIQAAATAEEIFSQSELEKKNEPCCDRYPIYREHRFDCPEWEALPDCELCGTKIEDPAHGREYNLPSQETKHLAHNNCIPKVAYVNAYSVTRHYGGREEGGWWYNHGEPLASIPVAMDDAFKANDMKTYLKELLEPLYAHGDIYSMRGGAEVQISVEGHMAEPWPATKPRYE